MRLNRGGAGKQRWGGCGHVGDEGPEGKETHFWTKLNKVGKSLQRKIQLLPQYFQDQSFMG